MLSRRGSSTISLTRPQNKAFGGSEANATPMICPSTPSSVCGASSFFSAAKEDWKAILGYEECPADKADLETWTNDIPWFVDILGLNVSLVILPQFSISKHLFLYRMTYGMITLPIVF